MIQLEISVDLLQLLWFFDFDRRVLLDGEV